MENVSLVTKKQLRFRLYGEDFGFTPKRLVVQITVM